MEQKEHESQRYLMETYSLKSATWDINMQHQEKIGHSGSRFRVLKSLAIEKTKILRCDYLGEFCLSEGYRFFMFSNYPSASAFVH